MELSPQAITGVEFTQVRKGYDPEEVKSFLARLAAGLEEMRSHLVASDARARAAMARVQELSSREPVGDTEVISKTLLMAQRTADTVVGEAQRSADETLSSADLRSKNMVAEAEAKAAETLRQSELMARNHAESELRSLNERRAALQSEVEQLNEGIVAERERVAAVIESLQRLLRSPEGLGTLSYRPAPSYTASSGGSGSSAASQPPSVPAQSSPGSAAPAAGVPADQAQPPVWSADSAFASPPVRLAGHIDADIPIPEGWATGEVPVVDPWSVG